MWIKGHYAMGQKYKEKLDIIRKHCIHIKQENCVSSCTDRRFREAYFQEHNQEADHLADLDAEGKRNITIEKRDNTENWKAVRGGWDGSTKTDGRSGCVVVIEGMDQDKWITNSKIAVPWKTCAGMAAEVAGASVLTGILDLVLAIIHCGKRKPVH